MDSTIMEGNHYSDISSDGESSVLTMQNDETDVPHDTPVDGASSDVIDSTDTAEIEYECVSLSDHGSLRSEVSTGGEATLPVCNIFAVPCKSSLESCFTRREEDSDNSSVETVELKRTTWPLCVNCKGYTNSLYRYCRKCFQKRKELFPPRPKGFKKRDKVEEKIKKCKTKGCSQDSDIGTLNSNTLNTQSEQNELKRMRPSHSNTEEFESETEISKRLKLDLGENNHESPVLKVHLDHNYSEACKKSVETPPNNNKNKASSNNTKSVTTEKNESEDKEEMKNNEYNSGSFAVAKELCIMCATVIKDGIFLHGTTGHVACCYQCSIKAWNTTKCCPVCKAKVRNVAKIYYS